MSVGGIAKSFWAGCTFGLLALLPAAGEDHVGDAVVFSSADGLDISAYWREADVSETEAATKPTATIMLFHMAGSSAIGEYSEIAPRFNAAGYNTLAVDLRSGGARLGAPNKTAERVENADVSYCDAYADMVAALDWVTARSGTGKVFALGSSYSAGLVIKLAGDHSESLSGVMAFSPASGAPMADCRPDAYLTELAVPLIAFRPDSEMDVPSVQAQAALFREKDIPYLEIENGKHGSLMLRSSQTGFNMEHAWQPVMEFLNQIVGKN